MTLLNKLFEMRDLGLLSFQDEETGDGRKPVGEIEETQLWSKIEAFWQEMSAKGVLFSDAPIGIGNVHAYIPNSDLESNIVATRHKQCYTLLLCPKHHEP
jgi:hypothetical protein